MRPPRCVLVMGVVGLALVGSLAPPASGAVGGSIPIRVGPTGQVVEAGAAAKIRVGTICPVGWEVLEAFATLSQDGEGSELGFIPMTCDGVGRMYSVRVPSYPGSSFLPGLATASVYVLILNQQSGETRTGNALADVALR